jgi:hypothetical protein
LTKQCQMSRGFTPMMFPAPSRSMLIAERSRVARLPGMVPTEFFRWYITDERTGKRRADALRDDACRCGGTFPGRRADLGTREVRELPEPGEVRSNTRPPAATS